MRSRGARGGVAACAAGTAPLRPAALPLLALWRLPAHLTHRDACVPAQCLYWADAAQCCARHLRACCPMDWGSKCMQS